MKSKHWLSLLCILGGIIFLASFVGGVVSASEDEGELSPWYAVDQADAIPNMISLLLTYGDFDRGCRCFPRTDDHPDFGTGQCTNSTANCNTLPCRVNSGGTGNANYCTDHNAWGPDRFGGSMAQRVIQFSGGSNKTSSPDPGEFRGFFDWMEDIVADMFRERPDFAFPILQTMLCGTTTCMSAMGSDTCMVIADGNVSGGNVCYQGSGGSINDDIMLWANRAFAKIYPLYDAWGLPTLRTVVAMYAVQQNYATTHPSFVWPPGSTNHPSFPNYNNPDENRYSSSTAGNVGSSEVCMEAYMDGPDLNADIVIYTDAMIIRIDMAMIMGENPWTGDESLFDLCVTEAQMDFKSAQAVGLLGGSENMNCDMEDGEDNSNDMNMDLEQMPLLHAMLKSMVNEIYHGSCPGAYHFCTRYQTNQYARGSGCQARRCGRP